MLKMFQRTKKHNIEIIDDLKEKDKIYKSLVASKLNFTDYYSKVKVILEKLEQNIQKNNSIYFQKIRGFKKFSSSR